MPKLSQSILNIPTVAWLLRNSVNVVKWKKKLVAKSKWWKNCIIKMLNTLNTRFRWVRVFGSQWIRFRAKVTWESRMADHSLCNNYKCTFLAKVKFNVITNFLWLTESYLYSSRYTLSWIDNSVVTFVKQHNSYKNICRLK